MYKMTELAITESNHSRVLSTFSLSRFWNTVLSCYISIAVMAAPGGQFFIQQKIKNVLPHHESFQQLWETKWKKPVRQNRISAQSLSANSRCRQKWGFTHLCLERPRISSPLLKQWQRYEYLKRL
jgi:hypothetical protein